jgi:Tfp pilus assembly protein PilF
MNLPVRLAALSLCAAVAAGCSARQGSLAHRFVKPGEPAWSIPAAPVQAPEQDLQEFARKLRELQVKAGPRSQSLLPTIESRDPRLAAALLRLAMEPGPDSHRMVADAYRAAGVNDHAFRHFQRALKLDACDSAAYEGLAQIWRDWGMPGLGLGDAHRAIYCRPHSASAYNTLGTVLFALGQPQPARESFEFALQLQPDAAFALNNLCYMAVRAMDGARAEKSCRQALAMAPEMAAASNNLALAYAVQGELDRATLRLLDSPDVAQAHYNVGILMMASAQYDAAARAFDKAAAERPGYWIALRRAAQARELAKEQGRQ